MSHDQQIFYFTKMQSLFPDFFNSGKVLEVGSLDINGSVRDLFDVEQYIGIDLEKGPGVDLVAQGQDFYYPDEYFDCSVSAECFEHNPYWKETFLNMIRMTKDGGLIIISCAGEGRPEHGTARTTPLDSPFTINAGWDYYKNLTENDFHQNINLDEYFSEYKFEINDIAKDLYFYGVVKK